MNQTVSLLKILYFRKEIRQLQNNLWYRPNIGEVVRVTQGLGEKGNIRLLRDLRNRVERTEVEADIIMSLGIFLLSKNIHLVFT